LFRSADLQSAVSPIFNRQGTGTGSRGAGCKPAILQIANLRYDFVTGRGWQAIITKNKYNWQ
jgi:hypothetical protein